MKQFAYCSRLIDFAAVLGGRFYGFGVRRVARVSACSPYMRIYRVNFGFGTVMLCLNPPR